MNDVKQIKRPEELTIEELEELGVELTEWETKVAGNRRFRQLRLTDVPKWGQLATGIRRTEFAGQPLGSYVDTEQEPLTPSQWRKQFDNWHQENGPAVRSLGILAAKLARAYPTQGPDRILLQNLCALLNQEPDFSRFRWEKQAAENIEAREKAIQEEVRQQKIEAMQQGEARVTVIPLGGILPWHVKRWHKALVGAIISEDGLTLPGAFDKVPAILPFVRCHFCGNRGSDGYGSHDCQLQRAFVLVDCQETLASLPKRLQKRQVSFRVPRNTFEPAASLDQLLPRMWLFLLDGLRRPAREQLIQQLESHLKRAQPPQIANPQDPRQGTQNVLVRPTDGSSKVILLSGPAIDWNWSKINAFLREIQMTKPALQKVLGPNTPISFSRVHA